MAVTSAKLARKSNRGSKPGERRGGRQKGTPNKVTGALKDMVLQALNEAHEDGGVAYLKEQATKSPAAFLALVGKILPTQLTGEGYGPIETRDVTEDTEIVDKLIAQLANRAENRPTLQ
jgi:hypothetical protein